MAEDLCRKSAIIETYVMDSRIGEDYDIQEGTSLGRARFWGLQLLEKLCWVWLVKQRASTQVEG